VRAFTGIYDLSIDGTNRLMIPAEIRRALDTEVDGKSFFLVTGVNEKPWLWPEKQYGTHAHGRGSMIAPDEADLQFDYLIYSLAVQLEMDKQGRILIPDRIMKESAIAREITLVSVRDHLEIWDRPSWIAFKHELERTRTAILAKAKQPQPLPLTSTINASPQGVVAVNQG
jgi:MraZ protein